VNLVEHVHDHDLPAPLLTPDVFYGRVEDSFDPHSLLSSLVLKMDGEITSWMAFCDKPAEDHPGTALLSHQNAFDGKPLRPIGPLVYVERLCPAAVEHELRGDVKNDYVEIIKGDVAEPTLFNVDRPVTDTLLIVAKLSVRHMALTDDLAVAILEKKPFDPPFLFNFHSVLRYFCQPPFGILFYCCPPSWNYFIFKYLTMHTALAGQRFLNSVVPRTGDGAEFLSTL